MSGFLTAEAAIVGRCIRANLLDIHTGRPSVEYKNTCTYTHNTKSVPCVVLNPIPSKYSLHYERFQQPPVLSAVKRR